MSNQRPNFDELHADVRLLKHHLRRKRFTAAEHQAFLDSLPDEAEHGESTVTRFQARAGLQQSDKG